MLDKIKDLLTDKNKELIEIYQTKKCFFNSVEDVEHFLKENNYNNYHHSIIQNYGYGTKEESIVIHDNRFFSIEFGNFINYEPRFLFHNDKEERTFALELNKGFSFYFQLDGKENYFYHDRQYSNSVNTYLHPTTLEIKPPAVFFDIMFEAEINININELIDITNLSFDLQIFSDEAKNILTLLLETINETKEKLNILSNRPMIKPKIN